MVLITKFSEVACKSWAVFIQQPLTVPMQEAESILIPFFFLQDVVYWNWIVSAEGCDLSLLKSLEVFYRFRQVWASTLGKINTAASAHPFSPLRTERKIETDFGEGAGWTELFVFLGGWEVVGIG